MARGPRENEFRVALCRHCLIFADRGGFLCPRGWEDCHLRTFDLSFKYLFDLQPKDSSANAYFGGFVSSSESSWAFHARVRARSMSPVALAALDWSMNCWTCLTISCWLAVSVRPAIFLRFCWVAVSIWLAVLRCWAAWSPTGPPDK